MFTDKKPKRILIKIGGRFFEGKFWWLKLIILAYDISRLTKQNGYEFGIISSGAVKLGSKIVPDAKKETQAMVGQHILMTWYHRCFSIFGLTVGQGLYTSQELHQDKKHHTADCLIDAWENFVIPVINANDVVNAKELEALGRYEDNDELLLDIALLVEADLVVILTNLRDAVDRGEDILWEVNVADLDHIQRAISVADHVNEGSTGGSRKKIDVAICLAENKIITHIVDLKSRFFLSVIFSGRNPGQKFF